MTRRTPDNPIWRRLQWLLLATLMSAVAALVIMGPVRVEADDDPSDEADDDPPAEADDDRPAEADGEMRRKVQERIRVLRALKIEEHLQLDKATLDKLLKVLDGYDQRSHDQHKEIEQLRRKLKRAMKQGGSDQEIEQARLKLIEGHKKIDALRYERLEKASALLAPRDRVKLMIFLPKFEREVRKVIRDVRKDGPKGRRGGPGGRGGGRGLGGGRGGL